MSKNREIKQAKIDELKSKLTGKSLIFMDYQGIDVEGISSLRKEIREFGGVIKIAKNTLLKKVVKDEKIDLNDDFFKGMLATAIVEGDKFVNVGKSIFQAEKSKKIKIKGGFFEGAVIDEKKVRKYASLLSKEEMHGVLVGCLSGLIGNLVYVLEDIAKEKKDVVADDKTS